MFTDSSVAELVATAAALARELRKFTGKSRVPDVHIAAGNLLAAISGFLVRDHSRWPALDLRQVAEAIQGLRSIAIQPDAPGAAAAIESIVCQLQPKPRWTRATNTLVPPGEPPISFKKLEGVIRTAIFDAFEAANWAIDMDVPKVQGEIDLAVKGLNRDLRRLQSKLQFQFSRGRIRWRLATPIAITPIPPVIVPFVPKSPSLRSSP